MTTPWAARSAARRRPIFLGVVVPILYVLALTGTVMAASDRAEAARPVELPQGAAWTVRAAPAVQLAQPQHLARATHRHVAEPSADRARRRLVAVPKPVDVPVISRSDVRRVPTAITQPPPFVVRVSSITTPATMQAAINACDGPVAIDWSADPSEWGVHPMEIAEHDYCGGSVFTSLATGRRVQVLGGGLSGLYVVNGRRRFVPSDAWASELNGLGDIALQTCVSNGMILVGLDRIG